MLFNCFIELLLLLYVFSNIDILNEVNMDKKIVVLFFFMDVCNLIVLIFVKMCVIYIIK